MDKKLRFLIITVVVGLFVGFSNYDNADKTQAHAAGPGDVSPENTVILANQADARFSQDFSVLLSQLRLEWVILGSTVLPESVWDKNLVLLGHPDAAVTGEVIRGILTAEEIETLRTTTDRHIIIEKESPWAEGRTVTICSGADMLLTRNAAEEAFRDIIGAAPPASDWIQTTFDAELDEDLRDYMDQLLFEWDDAELPLADLTMDVDAKSPWRISAQQAAEDVERLFYLFAHGYSGYAFFNQNGEFEQARERILQELPSRSSWSSDAFSSLLHDHLSFIVDCHTKIGDFQYAGHQDFWYDTHLELTLESGGYQFADDGTAYTVVSINGSDPAPFILPSLNHQGEPIYRLGLLSPAEPAPLLLTAADETGERQFEIELQRSNFTYYSEDIFREDIIGGIPVVRVRSFSDPYADALSQFVKTASSHRGEPVIIVDIRGNHGGNERWPINWIRGLTGERAESVFIFSELTSKTTMAARANVFAYLYDRNPDVTLYKDDGERHTLIAEAFESGTRQPNWVGPYFPLVPLIPNDTTVILVTNGSVASAGEGLIMRLSQAENVVVVGENSMGCLTFGNGGAHQLPHSKLKVWLPINFGLYLDKEFREEVGLRPDLWVPAEDAVNYAVAAVRQGTITTSQPLPLAMLQQNFVPESAWTRFLNLRYAGVAAFLSAMGSIWAYVMRKRPKIVTSAGAVWLVFGRIWMVLSPEKPIGIGVILAGVICLVWGGTNLWLARRTRLEELAPLIQLFAAEDRETLYAQVEKYDELLRELLDSARTTDVNSEQTNGILALNGASGAGQSYVLERVEALLEKRSIELPRIYLLATRSPRPGEGHKEPYIFVKDTDAGFQDIHHPEVMYSQDEIYYYYQSRPGAANAILMDDVRAAMNKPMYLETVIPTLLHIMTTRIGEVPPWGENLKIVYLATPSGKEWLYRLLNREPTKLESEEWRASIMGRVNSSIGDMEQAVKHKVQAVLNWHGKGEQAAQEILSIWGFD